MPEGRPIVFRCDADPVTGLGHLARCSRLAAAVSDAPRILLSSAPLAEGTRPWAAAFDEVRVVGPSARAVLAEARRHKAGALVVDGYGLVGAFYERPVNRPFVRVAIDDGPPRALGVDLLVEPNLGSVAAGYEVAPGGLVLAGASYALIAPQIVKARAHVRPIAPEARRILVTAGASDPTCMTERFLDVLASSAFEARVLVGPLNERRDALVALARRAGIEPVVGAPSIAEHAVWCDMALSCLGGTASELACLGVPNFAVAIHPRQLEHHASYAALGLVVSLGWHESFSIDATRRQLEAAAQDRALRTRLREAGMMAVDGLGAKRVAGEIEKRAAKTG